MGSYSLLTEVPVSVPHCVFLPVDTCLRGGGPSLAAAVRELVR